MRRRVVKPTCLLYKDSIKGRLLDEFLLDVVETCMVESALKARHIVCVFSNGDRFDSTSDRGRSCERA